MIIDNAEASGMRPVATEDDSWLAAAILARFIGDEPWKLDALIPGGQTFRGIKIAANGLAALFDVFAEAEWVEALQPLGRVLLRVPAISSAIPDENRAA